VLHPSEIRVEGVLPEFHRRDAKTISNHVCGKRLVRNDRTRLHGFTIEPDGQGFVRAGFEVARGGSQRRGGGCLLQNEPAHGILSALVRAGFTSNQRGIAGVAGRLLPP
jgi:hypothetical protein